MSAAEKLSTFEQTIVDHVRDSGCHINVVAPAEGDEGVPFAYSVGFPESVGQPEVIVFGLDGKLMAAMINATLSQCRAGLQLKDGLRLSGLLSGFDCILRAVEPDAIDVEHFNSALWYHHRRTGEPLDRAFQIVWPGYQDGLFPWDASADPGVSASQPPLYRKSVV